MHPRSLIDVLRRHADARPDEIAYSFLDDGERPGQSLTYAALDEQARGVAATLQQLTSPGDRALLLYPPGLDFVVAFLGCQYAGVIAVPALPPTMSRVQATMDRLSGVIAGATPAIALTTAELLPPLRAAARQVGPGSRLLWQATDRLGRGRADLWRPGPVDPDALSFLQYTSGSTSEPKGVMVSHRALLANLEMLRATADLPGRYNFVSWLPLFHDMGLIGVVLHGLFVGGETRLMSPLSFLKRPARWLRAIAELSARGDIFSGGPNFAFDLCAQRIGESERESLDLRGWKVAFCGAETVRAGTMERFAAAFAGCGLDRRALLPCYGLAEATLVVSARTPGRAYQTREVARAALERGLADKTREGDADPLVVVSCGSTRIEQEIVVVDPESRRPCADARVGEIWVRGPNLARGYWQDPERTRETFEATTAAGEGPYLRTGDLGFLVDGELHVTGRIKELILVRGRCVYPQDLEHMIESMAATFPEIVAGEAVTFALPGDADEGIGVIVRIARRRCRDPQALIEAIIARALEQFEVGLAEVTLITAAPLRTSSGKKMRGACARKMAGGGLEELGVVARWERGATDIDEGRAEARVTPGRPAGAAIDRDALARRIAAWIAHEEGIDPARISTARPLTDFGLDSLAAVSLTEVLETELGIAVSVALLRECRTIDELSDRLALARR